MAIKRQGFSATLLPPEPAPGERSFYPDNTAPSMAQAFVVPADVFRISAVVVGSGAPENVQREAYITRAGVRLLSSLEAIAGPVGGGNGGVGSWGMGGAGGYTGNGGNGFSGDSGSSGPGSPGSGGGGGGGGWTTGGGSGHGGGVGLQGHGANGAGGSAGAKGGTGSPAPGGWPAGAGSLASRSPGGNLRWRNDIAVTPGETLVVNFQDAGPAGSAAGNSAAVRVMWGGSRSYPSNALDAIPAGQQTLTAVNTTFTVPDKVTTICACAQQLHGGSAAVTLVVSGATVLRAQNGSRLGDGGGDGGLIVANQGGGGAGGYSGNGGNSAANGSGGGGAGGEAGYLVQNPPGPVFGGSNPNPTYTTVPATNGGGVGISGAGASGLAAGPRTGSPDPVNGHIGGGIASAGNASGNGGALAYKNAIAVTPGQVLTVNAAGGRIRIIWGPGRSYPSNAGNA